MTKKKKLGLATLLTALLYAGTATGTVEPAPGQPYNLVVTWLDWGPPGPVPVPVGCPTEAHPVLRYTVVQGVPYGNAQVQASEVARDGLAWGPSQWLPPSVIVGVRAVTSGAPAAPERK